MDYYVLNLFNQYVGRWPMLDAAAVFFAGYLDFFVILLLFIWVFWDLVFQRFLVRRTLKIVIGALAAALLSRFVVAGLIQLILVRPRPFLDHNINQLLESASSYSFPSGHASFFFALATVVYLLRPQSGLYLYIAAIIIVLARIYVGLHYPLDILGGAIIGILVGWLVVKVMDKYFKRDF